MLSYSLFYMYIYTLCHFALAMVAKSVEPLFIRVFGVNMGANTMLEC